MVFTSFRRATLLLLVWAGLAAQGLPALAVGVFLHNATGGDIHVSNALFSETSRSADILFEAYEPGSLLPYSSGVQAPSLNPSANTQVLRPGATAVFTALEPKGHFSVHMLTQEGQPEPLYVAYAVDCNGELLTGDLQGFVPGEAEAPEEPFAAVVQEQVYGLTLVPVPVEVRAAASAAQPS